MEFEFDDQGNLVAKDGTKVELSELKMTSSGVLVDGEGKPVVVGDKPIKITNARTQEQVDLAVQKRLERQTDRIKALEAQANRTPELEKLLQEMRAEKEKIEADLLTARESAQEEVAQQISQLSKRSQDLERELETERVARIHDQVSNQIIAKASDRFINPMVDLVPKLLTVHKREPAKDSDGKTIRGQHVDLFKVPYADEKGNVVEDYVPLDKALDAIASRQEYQHYLRPTAQGGSGGGNYLNVTNMKRSQMTAEDKAKFVGKHGVEAYQKLPE
jgi:hypothetical protein